MRTAIRITLVHRRYLSLSLYAVVCLLASSTALAQNTAFTYQGKLSEAGNPANAQYDFQFKLFDTATLDTGTQQGSIVSVANVNVTNGIFTVQLDFGVCASCFNGSTRFLEIAVKPTSSGLFTRLGPRQPITSNPYAIRSLNAAAADGLSVACVNCVTSSQIQSVQGSQVSGAIPVGSVPGGSASYIQNGTSQQATSDFNISGNGTLAGSLSANVVNAITQYNIGGNRMLSNAGGGNLFAGVGAGAANLASFNSYVGFSAGQTSTSGASNSFFGSSAGQTNTTGGANSFFGVLAGGGNTTGSNNTIIGTNANVASGNLTFATAIGAGAVVSASNSVALGRSADTVRVPGSLNVSGAATLSSLNLLGALSADIVNATSQYNLGGSRVLSNAGTGSLFVGIGAGANTTGTGNAFLGSNAGFFNTTGISNVFLGASAGFGNTTGYYNTFVGTLSGPSNSVENNNTYIGANTNGATAITNATAIGYRAEVTRSNSLILGSINGLNGGPADTNVGIGTTSPQAPLHLQRDGDASNNWQNAQLRISGATDPNKQLNIGYDTTSNRGVIQAGQHTVAYKDLLLNPFGGNIGIGTTNPTAKLTFEGSIIGNFSNPLAYFNNTNSTGNSGPTLRVAGNGNAVDGVLNVSAFGTGKIASFGSNAGGGEVANIDVNGNLAIAGNLSKGGGSFKIDHPLDPANKYLYHSFVESPDMMNIYNGNVTTNRRGEALVTLPEWFESLNKDFRYQLTVIGQFAQAIVASKIKNNRFRIKTNRPGVEVSWQVTGIRHDAYANNHRIEVEAEKPAQERGKYLHPEAFNLGKESSGRRE